MKNKVEKIFVVSKQLELIKRAVYDEWSYLWSQQQAIDADEESEYFEFHCNGQVPEDPIDKIIAKAEILNVIDHQISLLEEFIETEPEDVTEFLELRQELIEQIHRAIGSYQHRINIFMDAQLTIQPGDEFLFEYYFPASSITGLEKYYEPMREHLFDTSFYDSEYDSCTDLSYHLRNYYANNCPKSEDERIDRMLEFYIESK